MNSIRKIGNAALERLIQSKARELNVQYEPRIRFEESEFDLDTVCYGEPEYLGNDIYGDYVQYAVWGIELGFKILSDFEFKSQSVTSRIREMVASRAFGAPDVPLPSHVVIACASVDRHGNCNSDFFGANSFLIYRLSQRQETGLKKTAVSS